MSKIALFVIIMVSVMGVGCESEVPPPSVSDPAINKIAVSYRGFQRMTAEPVRSSFPIVLCRPQTPREILASQGENPHVYGFSFVYMNKLAAEAYASKSYPYPIGSVIVKDKNAEALKDVEDASAVGYSKGVGGMVKREPGYDSEFGDWQYFYFEDPANIEQGKIENCVNCHARTKATDFVFADWDDSY